MGRLSVLVHFVHVMPLSCSVFSQSVSPQMQCSCGRGVSFRPLLSLFSVSVYVSSSLKKTPVSVDPFTTVASPGSEDVIPTEAPSPIAPATETPKTRLYQESYPT